MLWAVQNRALAKDEVDLDAPVLDEFMQAQTQSLKLSLPTFLRGLAELVKAQIIAKTIRRGRYFINPNFVFNGDRIAFTTIISRRKQNGHDPNTIDFIDRVSDEKMVSQKT